MNATAMKQESMHDTRHLLTLDEAAARLTVSRDTVRRDTRLEKIKVGPRSIRIKAADIDSILGSRLSRDL